MKFSNFFIPTFKEDPSDASLKSHILMLKSGMIKQETSGIYTWMPLGYRVLKKIINFIEKEHELNEINQILMPTIQSSEIWKISNRYDTYGKEMLRINDRHKKELLYGPTNEEMIASLGKHYIKSYKDLPLYLYQIQTKFRDEIRPRFGVMRAREFIMKDAYSFDCNEASGENTYKKFYKIYLQIFKKLNIKIIPVRAPSGEIGGNMSHEFHLIVESGESSIIVEKKMFEENLEQYDIKKIKSMNSYTDDFEEKENQKKDLKKLKSIELGHIFLFGLKYSKSFNLTIDHDNGKIFPFMGSYGIGISRIPAAIIESSHDERGIIWPSQITPFDLSIINLLTKDNIVNQFCDKLYKDLKKRNFDVIYDDRDERAGVKFSDNDLIGIPIQIIVGKKFVNENKLSLKFRKNSQEIFIDKNQIFEYLKDNKL